VRFDQGSVFAFFRPVRRDFLATSLSRCGELVEECLEQKNFDAIHTLGAVSEDDDDLA
jgi:hypothetical protein